MKFFNPQKKQKNKNGFALLMTIIIVSVMGVLIQGAFVVSSIRSRESVLSENAGFVRQASKFGLECGLYQITKTESIRASGQTALCAGTRPTLSNTTLAGYQRQMFVYESPNSCALVYFFNSNNNYRLRSDGFSNCTASGPVNSPETRSGTLTVELVFQPGIGIVTMSPIQ